MNKHKNINQGIVDSSNSKLIHTKPHTLLTCAENTDVAIFKPIDKSKYKYMKPISVLFLLCAMALTSCEKYLDIKPKGKTLIETIEDYDALMANPDFTKPITQGLEFISADNVLKRTDSLGTYFNEPRGKAYLWKDNFYLSTDDDPTWLTAYEHIFNYNLVINNIMKIKGGSDTDKKRILAEAKVNRAYTYFILNLLYAPAYDSKTSFSDLSVPLVTDNNWDAKRRRNNVDKVVATILDDLQEFGSLPKTTGANTYRITQGGAYALSARVYLYLGNFEKALDNAEKALAINAKLYDYTKLEFQDPEDPILGEKNWPKNEFLSPELLMFRDQFTLNILENMTIAKSLEKLYNPNDLRLKFYYTNKIFGSPKPDKFYSFLRETSNSISVPEMMLIKAECLARKGDVKCLEVLKKLREKRFTADDLEDLEGTTPEELLKVTLEERQRELFYKNLRWYDMKRLAKEGIYTQTLLREYYGTQYKLEPNSNKYLYPISIKLNKINPDIKLNPNQIKQGN